MTFAKNNKNMEKVMEKETKIKNSVNVRNIYDSVILNLVLYPGTDFFGNILKNEMP
jgi:hypothetical protein